MFFTYQVDGTSGGDSISISISGNNIISVVNGNSASGSDIINNNIEINGLGGNDTISIIETGANTVVVNGGGGDDTINIGNGANDLDNIDDFITVNGDANTDTVVLFNQNDANGGDFTLSSSNQYSRAGMPAITATVENVTINASNSINENIRINDPPSADVTINGGGSGQSDSIVMDGAGTRSGTYRPDALIFQKGTIDFSTATINFTQCDAVVFNDFTTATLITPNINDSVTLSSVSTSTVINGSSSGVSWTLMQVSSTSNLILDLATNDLINSNIDTVSGSVGTPGASLLSINAGSGTNTFTASGGTWNVTGVGGAGAFLDVKVNVATVNFSGFQTLNRLELNNGGSAQFTGAGTVLNAKELTVVNGTGNMNLSAGQLASNLNTGTFSVGAGRTFVKKGAGQLTIAGTQSHGAGSLVDVQNGTMNFNTDCGSPSSRTLSVQATGGTTNFNITQHLASLFAGPGIANLVGNGNRVLVTNAVGVANEGGGINLNNNDMIVDYTGASELLNVRALLAGGYSAGNWNGIGINSATAAADATISTALGYSEASTILGPSGGTFSGQTVDGTAVLVKYTFYGDANLDGGVDTIDFNNVAANFGKTNRIWDQGDFDYGFDVDTVDFNLLAANFSKTGLGPVASRAPAGASATTATGLFSDSTLDNADLI